MKSTALKLGFTLATCVALVVGCSSSGSGGDKPKAPESVPAICQIIIDAVAAPITLEGHELRVTCSMGIAHYPADGASAEALLTKPIDFAALRSEIDSRVGSVAP